jgi:hypothetical protein
MAWDISLGQIYHRQVTILYDDIDIVLYQGTRNGIDRPIWAYARLPDGFWYSCNHRPTTRNELTLTINYLRKARKRTVLNKIALMKKKKYTLVETFGHLDFLFVNMKYTPDWMIRETMLDLQSTFDRNKLNMFYPFILVSRNLNIRTTLVRKKKILDYFCELFDKKFSLDHYKPSLNLEDYRFSLDVFRYGSNPLTYEEFLELLDGISESEIADMIWRYGLELSENQWKEKEISLKKQLYHLMIKNQE